MTVKELIKKLQEMPADSKVMLASDEEGNNFGNLCDVEFIPFDSTGYPCHPDDVDEKYSVVLWPQ